MSKSPEFYKKFYFSLSREQNTSFKAVSLRTLHAFTILNTCALYYAIYKNLAIYLNLLIYSRYFYYCLTPQYGFKFIFLLQFTALLYFYQTKINSYLLGLVEVSDTNYLTYPFPASRINILSVYKQDVYSIHAKYLRRYKLDSNLLFSATYMHYTHLSYSSLLYLSNVLFHVPKYQLPI